METKKIFALKIIRRSQICIPISLDILLTFHLYIKYRRVLYFDTVHLLKYNHFNIKINYYFIII